MPAIRGALVPFSVLAVHGQRMMTEAVSCSGSPNEPHSHRLLLIWTVSLADPAQVHLPVLVSFSMTTSCSTLKR